MPLEIQPAVDEDAPRLAAIERDAYSDNGLSPILFPGPFPEDALETRAQGLIQQRKDDPQMRWVKAVDSETNDIVAWAKWEIIDQPRESKPSSRTFGQGCNVQACEEYFGGIHQKRHELMDGKYHVLLDLLQTDPKHQGRGAGSMLIKWGTDIADKMRLPAYLESSPKAYKLYQKHGFNTIDVFTMDPKWGYGPDVDPNIRFMIRDIPAEA
ncbi:hypothetical protein PV10_01775 [Exophiala mesophila]|uniref:N-acetyltransferase domain-containing protein n=1 Tax=Exophiala mesophila TaxID=212818 RepID=A0A0D1ZU82_EXOME|nr:uncharacterized protein PV10_01775 [Exophiala mesophila]KIV98087.1 hypothetical protein PV10_01775 [Exophiala mesophila]